jgi:hypothetical protein
VVQPRQDWDDYTVALAVCGKNLDSDVLMM